MGNNDSVADSDMMDWHDLLLRYGFKVEKG